ncbi:MAG: 4-(cytidine 5'-diphospho)-2-C-methyl-D-erythritol kinase [Rhodospirillales bacterium]
MADNDQVISAFAPAKINLYLHVTGRRADGYHTLDSLIAFAGLGDTVTVKPANEISLEISGPLAGDVPTGGGNLVIKAARRLAEAAAIGSGAAITLTKRLPVGGGLGGGSADAAAALGLLSRLWEAGMDNAQLMELGLELGADVPVCLGGMSAVIGGVGEDITPTDPLPDCGLVLAYPEVSLATSEVFQAFAGPFSDRSPPQFTPQFTPMEPCGDAASLAAMLKERRNDLTGAAIKLAPAVGEALRELQSLPGVLLARMSGSGATCFALFEDLGQARSAAAGLAARRPQWWVEAAPLLGGDETMDKAGCA